MIPKSSIMRVARPTDKLEQITSMYTRGLGFEILFSFENHNGFNGTILGHSDHNYHLEFTHHLGTNVGRAPTQDNLLVFYLPQQAVWKNACHAMELAGFQHVDSYNSYWDTLGKTYEDLDGYRVVLQNEQWTE